VTLAGLGFSLLGGLLISLTLLATLFVESVSCRGSLGISDVVETFILGGLGGLGGSLVSSNSCFSSSFVSSARIDRLSRSFSAARLASRCYSSTNVVLGEAEEDPYLGSVREGGGVEDRERVERVEQQSGKFVLLSSSFLPSLELLLRMDQMLNLNNLLFHRSTSCVGWSQLWRAVGGVCGSDFLDGSNWRALYRLQLRPGLGDVYTAELFGR